MTDTPLHIQEKPASCAMAYCRMAVHKQTERDLGEAFFRSKGRELGVYLGDSQGTDPDPRRLAEMLNNCEGVKAEGKQDASLEELRQAVLSGHSAIVYVDLGLLHPDLSTLPSGHAVIVTDVQIDDQGNWRFLVNDPWLMLTDGLNKQVRGEDFIRAWSEFDCALIIVGRTE